jgi:hypothetical protein
MVDRYKPSAEEIKDLVAETGNNLEKEVTTIEHIDGTPCATVIDVSSHNITVVHEYDSGLTTVEEGDPVST